MPTTPEPLPSRTFRFACEIVRLYVSLSKGITVPPHICRQILSAGTSIGANVEEAQGAHSRRDKASKYSIALKEAYETRYWLRLIAATGLVPPAKVESFIGESSELIAILTVIRRKLNDTPKRGTALPQTPPQG